VPIGEYARGSDVAAVVDYHDLKPRPIRLRRDGSETRFKREPIVISGNNNAQLKQRFVPKALSTVGIPD